MKKPQFQYLSVIPVAIILMAAYKLMGNFDAVKSMAGKFMTILSPVIWALIISYFVSPAIDLFERRFTKKRAISLLVTYLLITALITLFFAVLMPNLIVNIRQLGDDIPNYIEVIKEQIQKLYDYALERNLIKYLSEDVIGRISKTASSVLNVAAGAVLSFIVGLFSSTIKIVIGFIISIYIVKDKEKLASQIRKATYAFLPEQTANRLANIAREIDDVFANYFRGQATDSLIVGVLATIGFSILGAPYALLLGLLLGLSNMIPSVGPFLGAIPAIGITLFYSPYKALLVLIFIVVLQQIDAYLINPRVVGGSVGLSPLWTIISIIVGGGLFGILGMVVAVPIMAIAMRMLNRYIDSKTV